MGFSLYKRTRFSNQWRTGVGEENKGLMCSAVRPLNKESVPGSGVFDTPIDRAVSDIVSPTLDGKQITATYGFTNQTEEPGASAEQPNTQDPIGTKTFTGYFASNTFKWRSVSFAYLHRPTGIATQAGNSFTHLKADITQRPVRTQNNAPFAEVADENVNTLVSYYHGHGLADGVTANTLMWSETEIQSEKVYETAIISGNGVTWLRTNDPALTPTDETSVGCLYEVDWSDIPHVYLANGVEVDPSVDTFDNSLGAIRMEDGNETLIGLIVNIGKEAGAWEQGLAQLSTIYFWEDGGKNYMLIGLDYDYWETVSFIYNQFQFQLFARESAEIDVHGRELSFYEYFANYKGLYPYEQAPSLLAGNYYSYSRGYSAISFEPDLPKNISLEGAGEYANLRLWRSQFRGNGGVSGDSDIEFVTDVTLADADSFIQSLADAPNEANNPRWTDSEAVVQQTFLTIPGIYPTTPYPDVNMSGPISEVLALNSWNPENRLRIAFREQDVNPPDSGLFVDSGTTTDVYSPMLLARFSFTPTMQEYKRTRFARVWRQRTSEGHIGFMKATIAPMHYESVKGSGKYDTSIDLTWNAVDDAELDGYRITDAGYQWGLQTDVQSGAQPDQGAVIWKDSSGAHQLVVTPRHFAYFYEPTRVDTQAGPSFDFTTGAAGADATRVNRTRNLGSHTDVPDEIVGTNGSMRWASLNTIGASSDQLAEYFTAAEKCDIQVKHSRAAVEWLAANDPPADTTDDTRFGTVFEIDWSGIPRVYLADGTLINPLTDQFDDTLGPIYLKDDNDVLLGVIAISQSASGFSAAFRWTEDSDAANAVVRKFFWESGGKNYVLVGYPYETFVYNGVRGYNYFSPLTITTEIYPDGSQGLNANDGFTGEYWNGYLGEINTYNTYNAIGAYFYDPPLGAWGTALRFHHELPPKALLTTGDNYANLILYDHYYPANRGVGDRGDYEGAVQWNAFVDVGGVDQGYLVDQDVNYGTGSWRDSYYFSSGTLDYPIDNKDSQTIDIAYPLQEFLNLNGVQEGNAVRMEVRGISDAPNYWVVDSYRNPFGKSGVLDVFYTYTHPPGGGKKQSKFKLPEFMNPAVIRRKKNLKREDDEALEMIRKYLDS